MAGEFDDLIPAKPKAGEFDDLVPKAGANSQSSATKGDVPSPDTGEDLYRQEGGMSLAESKAEVRGLAKGATSIVTAPADLGMWVGHKISKHIFGNDNDNYDNLSDARDHVLDAVLPAPKSADKNEQKGLGTLETNADVAGGFLAGAGLPGAGATRNLVADADKLWPSAGIASRSPNQSTINTMINKHFGVYSEEGGASELKQAKDGATSILDFVRNPSQYHYFDKNAMVRQIYGAFADSGAHSSQLQEFLAHPEVKRLLSMIDDGGANAKQLSEAGQGLRVASENLLEKDGKYSLSKAVGGVKDVVEDAIQKGMSGPMQDIYANARSKYRDFRSLMDSGAVNAETKNYNPIKLGRWLANKDEDGFSLGGNNSLMYNAARFGQKIAGDGYGEELARQGYGKIRAILKAATSTIPSAGVQRIVQGGPAAIKAAGRYLANYPGFATAFANAYEEGTKGESDVGTTR